MGHQTAYWVPALVAATLVFAGCSGDDAPTEIYELSGVVTERLTGDAVSGARVTFTSDTLYTESATTDGDGQYEMSVETDSPFGQVRAEKDGFVAAEKTVFFDMRVRRIDLELRREAAMED